MSNLNAHPVRVERERQGFTLETLADKAEVSIRSLSRAESFQSVSEDTKQKIADALGVDVSALWSEVRIGSIIAGPDGSYRVAATASDGSYIVSPVQFGPNEVVSADEIKQRFGVTVAVATQRERDGWRSLAEASRVNALAIARAESGTAASQTEINAAEQIGRGLFIEAHEEVTEQEDW